MIAVYVLVFGTLTARQQHRYATFGFDMGIFDQGIWLLSRFKDPFVTLRGLGFFGNHVNVTVLLLVPFYWLGAGPTFLYVAETVALAAGAVPIWLLARDRLQSEWLALPLAAAWLLFPSIEWINWWHFHPEVLAVTPFLFAYWFATRGRWRAFGVSCAIVLLCKEDTAFAVFALGLVVAWKEHHRFGPWIGLATSAGAAAWLFFATRFVIPHANGGLGPFYAELYPGFGNSVDTIGYNLIRHPSRFWHVALEHHRRTYYWQLLAPVGFVALLAPLVLLLAVPNAIVNVVSGHPYTYQIKYQYSSLVAGGIFLATVEACARWRRIRLVTLVLVGVVLGCSVAANVLWSPSPISRLYGPGVWPAASPRTHVQDEAVRLVPKDASVSATYAIDDHLTHRTHAYEWPTPFRTIYWGVHGEHPPDPATVEWLVLDRYTIGPEDRPMLAGLLGTQFEVVFDQQNILVAHRIAPPGTLGPR